MGIKHFFPWTKKNFSDSIYTLKNGETIKDIQEDFPLEKVEIDNQMIDVNGILHNVAQRVFEYGEHKPHKRLLGGFQKQYNHNSSEKQLLFFKGVCEAIDKLRQVCKPRKRLILCVDGPAPASKQQQQRSRRFVSARERMKDHRSQNGFDSNCITPGTKIMDRLTKYVDWYIRTMISSNEEWSKLEVIFSNEKVHGEGEHKCTGYVRKYGIKGETFCICGMDADLIMLSLGTHFDDFYILREDPKDPSIDYHFIDVKMLKRTLCEKMRWTKADRTNKEDDADDTKIRPYNPESAVNDFILMCFTVGNDFLPHIPAIEIIEGGIDFMLDIYKKTCVEHGHLTRYTEYGPRLVRHSMVHFLQKMSELEGMILSDKLKHRDHFFTDITLEDSVVNNKFDICTYRKLYYERNCPEIFNKADSVVDSMVDSSLDSIIDTEPNIEQFCHEYLEGMQWVLSYYINGVPCWKWRFLHNYAPFCHDLAKHVKTFKFVKYSTTTPTIPFVQLLCVLPPASASLLPSPLDTLLTNELTRFCPSQVNVDLSGKRKEWEGIVLLPILNTDLVEKLYYKYVRSVHEAERKRNIIGKSFTYTRGDQPTKFSSYYGDLETCNVKTSLIEI